MIADKDMIPNNLQIGPNTLLHLPIDQSTEQRPEFGYAQPGSDINGALQYAQSSPICLPSFLFAIYFSSFIISSNFITSFF